MTTSYYGKRGVPGTPGSISVVTPAWRPDVTLRCPVLAPESWMLKVGDEDWPRYCRIYLDLLDSRKPAVLEAVRQLPADAVLLCWESDGAHCHRRLFAGWWERETGEYIPEFTAQRSLFEEAGRG